MRTTDRAVETEYLSLQNRKVKGAPVTQEHMTRKREFEDLRRTVHRRSLKREMNLKTFPADAILLRVLLKRLEPPGEWVMPWKMP